jgi:Putative amidase domain
VRGVTGADDLVVGFLLLVVVGLGPGGMRVIAILRKHRVPGLVVLSTGLTVVGVLAVPGVAYAYNGANAATWANTYALSGDPAPQITFSSDDCTNFVSGALRAGGYPQHIYYNGTVPTSNDTYWYEVASALG